MNIPFFSLYPNQSQSNKWKKDWIERSKGTDIRLCSFNHIKVYRHNWTYTITYLFYYAFIKEWQWVLKRKRTFSPHNNDTFIITKMHLLRHRYNCVYDICSAPTNIKSNVWLWMKIEANDYEHINISLIDETVQLNE